MPNSRSGVASLLIAIIDAALFVAVWVLGFLQHYSVVRLSMTFFVTGIIGSVALLPLAFVLSGISLLKKGVSRSFPLIALAIEGCVLTIIVGVLVWWFTVPGNLSDLSVSGHGRYCYTGDIFGQEPLYRCVEKTDTIEAHLGETFGLAYTLNGGPDGGNVTVEQIWLYPPPGVRESPNSPNQLQVSRNTQSRIGLSSFMMYTFDHDWELVPGTWTFQIWVGQEKLVQRSFVVVLR